MAFSANLTENMNILIYTVPTKAFCDQYQTVKMAEANEKQPWRSNSLKSVINNDSFKAKSTSDSCYIPLPRLSCLGDSVLE